MGTATLPIREGKKRVHRAKWLRAAACAALACACAPGASASPSPAGPAANAAAAPLTRAVSAVNGWTVFQLSAPLRDLQLAAIAASGVKLVRSDAPWANIEPVPPGPTGHVWQFSGFDSWVSALASHHLTWAPLVDYSVWWAKTCPGFCAPTSDSTYAAFAQALAARYGAGGSFWAQNPHVPYYPAQIFEVWNEENNQTYWVPPARFATLYSAARSAIHSVDPSASVIVGGLTDEALPYDPSADYAAQYVNQMFAARPSLRGNVDGFGLHPYGTTAADAVKWTVHFRHVLDSLGEASAPIDITEFGWTTGDSSRETWRAWMMNTVGQVLSRSDCGIRLLAPYDWISPGNPSSGDFGLVDWTTLSTSLRLAGTTWFKALGIASGSPTLYLCGPKPKPKPAPPRRKHQRKRGHRPARKHARTHRG